MAAKHTRRRHRRRYSRRRRNPASGGVPLPNLMTAVTAAAGGVGSKMIAKQFLPAQFTTGYLGPLSTLGVGVGIGFVLKMLKQGKLAGPVVLGAGVIAAADMIKMFVPTLGSYVAPGATVPLLSTGVGMYPEGFSDPSLAGGDGNYPSGFEPSYDDIY